jgi:hypothetical protein
MLWKPCILSKKVSFRDPRRAEDIVRLGVISVRGVLVFLHRLLDGEVSWEIHDREIVAGGFLLRLGVIAVVYPFEVGVRRAVGELDDVRQKQSPQNPGKKLALRESAAINSPHLFV